MTQFYSAALVQLLCTVTVLFEVTLSVEHAPMLIWSTGRPQWDPNTTLHEGHIISAQELAVLLQPVITQSSENLVLIVQDKLSIEDFTYYSDTYGNKKPFENVQEILRSSSSLVLPAVGCKATRYLLGFLQESVNWKLTNITNLDVSQLEVNTSEQNLFVVQLQPFISNFNDISTLEAVAENDKIIGRLIMDLQERGINFSVIYTAMRPSR
ncbi:PREDICTED: V-type proton ATPase subunit S1-like, partial [Tinamus guttatus]|uniref:V-type proton ATPase subunit S1-like n=1 Tax=Tinamus guttatus TaxID=94827 RepID=UPI00052E926A